METVEGGSGSDFDRHFARRSSARGSSDSEAETITLRSAVEGGRLERRSNWIKKIKCQLMLCSGQLQPIQSGALS